MIQGGAGSGGIDALGVLDSRTLPDAEFSEFWDSILVPERIKTRLLCQSVLNFTMRPQLSRAAVPLHGVVLLTGPPGTGKTSLARGLASRTAESLQGRGEIIRFIEAEPHALTGAALGKSQRSVRDFLGGTVSEVAQLGPVIVLLDEVETLAVDRQKLSLEANPVDVHRASDAVLVQLDYIANQHSNVLFICTSNFPRAIDEAFLSRVDLRIELGLPDATICQTILMDTVARIAEAFPGLRRIVESLELSDVGSLCLGLDGRQIRKAVIGAFTFDKRTALDPERVTAQDILDAISEVQRSKEAR